MGTIGLGRSQVSGRNRVPDPPAISTARIIFSFSTKLLPIHLKSNFLSKLSPRTILEKYLKNKRAIAVLLAAIADFELIHQKRKNYFQSFAA
jgi:hypothetical protein